MKLIIDERPSLRNWLAFFLVGFVSAFLIGTALCSALWLIGQAAKSSGAPAPVKSMPSLFVEIRGILLFSGGFGVYLGTMMVFQSFRNQRRARARAVRVPGHHAVIGDFEHLPYYKTWTAKPLLPTGNTAMLRGHGTGPAEAETALWEQFIARYNELIPAATESLLTPPHPYQGCLSVALAPGWIDLGKDGGMTVDLVATPVPEDFRIPHEFLAPEGEDLAPSVIFTPTLELHRAIWA